MGIRHSVTNIQEAVTKVVSEIVSNTMQTSVNVVDYEQTLDVNCLNFKKALAKSFLECIEEERAAGRSVEMQIKLCSAPVDSFQCKVQSIVMRQAINVNLSDDQRDFVEVNVANNLSQRLESNLQTENGLLQFGNKTRQEIKDLVNITSQIFNTNNQEIYRDVKGKQRIVTDGGTVEFVTMTQMLDLVSQTFQNNQAFVDSSTKVATAIKAELDNRDKTINTIIWVSVSVVAALIVIIMIVLIIRSVRKKK